ncbi:MULTISPECIES: LacI family DNA-binding transcriptional regulator [unclassified Bacillus (in: firmicutes)]|uniref:LacI family DNA-binding transcriptional regulator n=1 Tax=unclassified Bacillus (in: firmicutes) TaxID=185979 RepID=UPI0008F279A6|nr:MULTISPECIES: LacI family DNA-binding transcriptional regulator [unclassified Bacillus (in: firmicutes)]SFA81381.1 transcriptional regulator, LacI family [Bacillus sp. UNCCL13]SFQ71473.1 transcriptional regulator, LacI family [Bacillus sp. cl95]
MSRRISIKDVADKAKVSIATVSNVMNGKGRMSEETIKHVTAVIDELGYTPNMAARNLKTNKSQLFGVVVPTEKKEKLYENPFYWSFVNGLESGMRERNYQVILEGINEEAESFSFVKERQLDGLVIIGTHEGSSIIDKVLALNVPCVFVDSYLEDPSLYQVMIDDHNGGYMATKHLIDLGHRNIAIITGRPVKGHVIDNRLQGHMKALEEVGIVFHEEYVIERPINTYGGYSSAQHIMEKYPNVTAVIAFSDITAMGAMKGFIDHGWHIPQEISIVGFDGLFFANFLSPSLTTVHQDIELKGKIALDLLMKQMDGKDVISNKKVVLPVELNIGTSTSKNE